jgi:HK97 family phage prohead protease
MNKQFLKGYVTKGEKENEYRVLASTSAIDRHGDSVDQNGWILNNYLKNPVMLWAHKYDELPVAKATSIEVTDKGLEMAFEFASAEGNPKAQQIKTLYDEGYLNAVSVGFIPMERNGNSITKSELLEVSFVPVPANQEALRLAMKSMDLTLIPELKGAIAEEIDAEEMYKMKCEKAEAVYEIFSAFYTTYFDEETSVDSFKTLVSEAASLLQAVADADTSEAPAEEEPADDTTEEEKEVTTTKKLDVKSVSKESIAKLFAFMAKDGRTLSAKTIKNIDTAITSMKEATIVLEQLKADSAADKQDEKASDKKEVEEEEVIEPAEANEDPIEQVDEPADDAEIIDLSAEDLQVMRRTFITDVKVREIGLTVVNRLIKEREEKGLK